MRGSSRRPPSQGGPDAPSTPRSPVAPTGLTPRRGAASRCRRVVDGSATLRRALADPSREGGRQAGAWPSGCSAARSAETTVAGRATSSASAGPTERDLADTLEALAVAGAPRVAPSAQGRIDHVEDELFRFERIVAGNPELRDTLTNRSADAEGKVGARPRAARGQGRAGDGAPGPRRPCSHRAGASFDRITRGLPRARRAPSRAAHRASSPRPTDSPSSSASGCGGAAGASTASRSCSRSSSTPRSSAASGSRSATRSSTARSCAASTRPAGTSPADRSTARIRTTN